MKPIRSNRLCLACYEPLEKDRLYQHYCSEKCADFAEKFLDKVFKKRRSYSATPKRPNRPKKLKKKIVRIMPKKFINWQVIVNPPKDTVYAVNENTIHLGLVTPKEYESMCRLSAERNGWHER